MPAAVLGGNFVLTNRRDMKTKKTIAIVGATENIGSAIATSLAKGNYHLILMSKDSEKLSKLKSNLLKDEGKEIIASNDCMREACWEADIIIVATPYEAQREVAEKIREVATGKIVISITNPLNKEYNDVVTSPNTSAAEELQRLLPDSKVVTTFNTTFAADFISPVIDGKRMDAFIAGNNSDAVSVVSDLVKSAGFNPTVAGDLSISRTLERLQLRLIQIALRSNFNWSTRGKILHN